MPTTDKSVAADRLAAAGLTIAVVLALGQTIAPWGWMGSLVLAGFHPRYWAVPLVYWLLILAWVVCVVSLLRRRRHYWILWTAPVILVPILVGGLIVVACMQGDCL